MSGFWTGGSEEHAKALRKTRNAALAKLKYKLKYTATPEKRLEIKQQIEDVWVEYEEQIRQMNNHLY